MPHINDQSTINAIARSFCAENRDKGKALRSAGYSRHYSEHGGLKLFDDVRVKNAIAKIDAKQGEKLDHTRDIAIANLNSDWNALSDLAVGGNIQAIQARTSIQRELSAISNLHSSTVLTSDTSPTIDPELAEELAAVAKRYKIRKANQRTA